MSSDYFEVEFTKRDGSKVYHIASSRYDIRQFMKMEDALSWRTISQSEPQEQPRVVKTKEG